MNYRVTKYNPAYRNEKGWYMRDDWTDYSEVVKTGAKSEYDEYKKIEEGKIPKYFLLSDDKFYKKYIRLLL